jgi:uncharacterized membrane protein (UPF0127 family)
VSTRAQVAVAAVVAVASAIGIGIIVSRWVSSGDARTPAPRGLVESAAVAPFAGYREVRIAIGPKCARVVVADTESHRAGGLRGTRDLGPYTGMLFVQPSDSTVAFTMAGVRDPLEIAWFGADGSRVGNAPMRACPQARNGNDCPLYRSPREYRTALEVPAGHPLPGQLAPC